VEVGNRMNGGTWRHTGQRAHVYWNAYWKFCNFDSIYHKPSNHDGSTMCWNDD